MVNPPVVQVNGGSSAMVRVRVARRGKLVGVGATVLCAGLADPRLSIVGLVDDGSNGDAVARDGVFTNTGVRTDCCAEIGPRVVRVIAQVEGGDGSETRHRCPGRRVSRGNDARRHGQLVAMDGGPQ